MILLGARALEGLLLWIDAKGKRLVDIEAHPLRKVVVPGPVPPDKDQYSAWSGDHSRARRSATSWRKLDAEKENDAPEKIMMAHRFMETQRIQDAARRVSSAPADAAAEMCRTFTARKWS